MNFHNYRYTMLATVASGLILAACATNNSAAPAQPASSEPAAAATTNAAAAQPSEQSTAKINLNTATDAEFQTIPNVGGRMVREFMEYRPYSSIQQFRKEIGKYVDEAQVAEYEKYVFVPIVPNEADAATLQQLPGVDQAMADQLIAGRPYATNADFLKKLGELVSAEQLAGAESYLEAQ